MTYTGTATEYWKSTTFELTDEWIITNGVDNVQMYNGSGQAADLSGSPPKCRQLYSYEGYLVFGDVTDAGNRYPQRIQWANHATTTGWAVGDSGNLDIDGVGILTGFARLQGFLLALSERAIDKLWVVVGDEVFDKKRALDGVGCYAPDSIIETNEGVYFYGTDNTFRFFTGFTWGSISSRIEGILKNLHPDYEANIQSLYNEEYDLCVWAIPSGNSTGRLDTLVVYDPDEDTWGISDRDVACMGSYEVETQYSWNTLPFTSWDSWPWEKWDTRLGLEGAPIDLIGGYDGQIYEIFGSDTDDGSDYTAKFGFPIDLGGKKSPHLKKRVLFIDVYTMSEGSGTLYFNINKDYAGFEAVGSIDLAGSAEILKQTIPCDFSLFSGIFQGYSTSRFRFLGVVFWYISLGRR